MGPKFGKRKQERWGEGAHALDGMKAAVAILLVAAGGFTSGAESWTLEQAVIFARTNAPDSVIARHRIAGANARIVQAEAAFWPTVQVQSSYSRTDNPVSVFGSVLNQRAYAPSLDFNNVPDVDNLNVRGIVTVPLYAGGRNVAGRAAARRNAAAAREEAEGVRNRLEFEVVRAHYTVVKARRFMEAAEQGVRALEASGEIGRKRFSAGNLLKADLLDIEVRLAHAREDLVKARNSEALALAAFKNLLGLEDREIDIAESAARPTVPETRMTPDRPELRALFARQAAAEAEVRRAKGGYLPKVDAFAQGDHDSGWRMDGSGRSYAVGVIARWDVWDGRLTKGRVSEARAAAAELEEEERKTRLEIGLEIERAQLRLEEANERVEVTRQAVTEAEESSRLTRIRFEQGAAVSAQLIDAETALTAARIRQAEAESDAQIALGALRHALGLSQLEGERG